MSTDPWGRVDEDGTVYVRTAEGSGPSGPGRPATRRRHLPTSGASSTSWSRRSICSNSGSAHRSGSRPGRDTIARLREAVTGAHAVGDLDGLADRLNASPELVGERREQVKAARDGRARRPSDQGADRRRGRADRDERPTGRTAASGCASSSRSGRPPSASTGPPRRRSGSGCPSARTAFAKRRKAYFAGLEGSARACAPEGTPRRRGRGTGRSTDWGATAAAYRELMQQWKHGGPRLP